ncbi:MAG TPA: ATP-binding protein [Bryobacteraceae bacterium]|nr:ATP-binding protein [Bryobacteraceae bacterium]
MKQRPDGFLLGNTRLTLYLGFGGLLLLMAMAGALGLRVLRQMHSSNDRLRQQFLFRNRSLNEIRSNLYLSGTYVRDYLLEPEPGKAEKHRASLDHVRGTMEAALVDYARQIGAQEAPPYAGLQRALAAYWEALAPILRWNPAQRRARGYPFFRDEVVPRRMAMLGIADQIANINEQQLNAGNALFAEMFSQFETRLLLTLLATLALGLSMALFTSRKILRLESDAVERFREIESTRAGLKHLSARLVQVQEEERRSISRELHDEVGQALSAMLVELRNLTAGIPGRSDQEVVRHLHVIKGLVEDSVGVVRNMALLLRPSMLDDLGLIPALQWQAREVSRRTTTDVTVTTELISDDFPDEHKTCVYRVVQEALHNCSRHAQATTVRIRVRQSAECLQLSIQDDGLGFDVKQSKGLGLVGIQERVTQLGGTFQVHSQPGAGAILTVELPLPRNEKENTIAARADTHPVSGRS